MQRALSNALSNPNNVKHGLHVCVQGQTRSAKKIPYWLWIIIAKILGIKLSPEDKPVISAVLHIATFGSAAGSRGRGEV